MTPRPPQGAHGTEPGAAAAQSHKRLRVLIGRIDKWEGIVDERMSHSEGEELLLDIKQCLESVVEQSAPPLVTPEPPREAPQAGQMPRNELMERARALRDTLVTDGRTIGAHIVSDLMEALQKAALHGAEAGPRDPVDEHFRVKFSQIDLDKQTKPLHVQMHVQIEFSMNEWPCDCGKIQPSSPMPINASEASPQATREEQS